VVVLIGDLNCLIPPRRSGIQHTRLCGESLDRTITTRYLVESVSRPHMSDQALVKDMHNPEILLP
jgi:hypothetical protein